MTVHISLLGTAALALFAGLRHGLDADHLAAIDGMTRFNMGKRSAIAPYCGALFSAGHGAAVVVAASFLARLASAWILPAWLEPIGKTISAAVLLSLGISNLFSIITSRQKSQPVHVTGLRTRLFSFVLRSSKPWQIMLVGVLFALSFDTLGLAALFASSAVLLGGAALATVLATAFAAGMIGVDTANGLWLSQLARKSDLAGDAASRVMTLSIALISLLVGAAIASSCVSSAFDQWLTIHELGVSLMVVLAVLCAYVIATQARAA